MMHRLFQVHHSSMTLQHLHSRARCLPGLAQGNYAGRTGSFTPEYTRKTTVKGLADIQEDSQKLFEK